MYVYFMQLKKKQYMYFLQAKNIASTIYSRVPPQFFKVRGGSLAYRAGVPIEVGRRPVQIRGPYEPEETG